MNKIICPDCQSAVWACRCDYLATLSDDELATHRAAAEQIAAEERAEEIANNGQFGVGA